MTQPSSAPRKPANPDNDDWRSPAVSTRVSARASHQIRAQVPAQVEGAAARGAAMAVVDANRQAYLDASAHIVVISVSALTRTCLMHCLSASETGLKVEGYADVEEWGRRGQGASVVLLCVTGARETAAAVDRLVARALSFVPGARVVVISDTRASADVSKAIEQGASGFIAMDSNVDVAIAAIRLVRSGGVFVPSHSVMQSQSPQVPDGWRSLREVVTAKQLEVIGLVRRGLPNKLIAAELEMSEFTVKVHVRNIMKRLNARNRTEVVALTNAFFNQDVEVNDPF